MLLLEACNLTGLACAVVLFYSDRQQIIGSVYRVYSFFHKTYHKTLSNIEPRGTGRYDVKRIESLLDPSGVATGSQAVYPNKSQAALNKYLWGKSSEIPSVCFSMT